MDDEAFIETKTNDNEYISIVVLFVGLGFLNV
jgi:hypothetical protein